MDAAVHPATGAFKFYVNGDAEGHLSFSTNEKDFAARPGQVRGEQLGLCLIGRWIDPAARRYSDGRSATRSRRCCIVLPTPRSA